MKQVNFESYLIRLITEIYLIPIYKCIWNFIIGLIADCFEVNRKLNGFWLSTYNNVKDAGECQQKHCHYATKCTAFVYNTKTKECTLKKVPVLLNGLGNLNRILKYEKGKIFGPKHCPGL